MAKINQGIYGPLTGKLGPVVGSSWKGVPYVKEKPKYVKNKKRSPAQIANNEKFAYVNEWLTPFHAYLMIGFSSVAVRQTEFGAALSAVYKTAFTGIMPEIEVDYSKIQISSGPLKNLTNPSITYTDEKQIHVSWDDSSGSGAKYNDQVMVALYSDELKQTDGFTCNVTRIQKEVSFLLQPEMRGKLLHMYIAVVSNNRKKASETIYLGEIIPI